MSKLLVGIDVGTTGVRCMLFDFHGNLVSGAYREYETKYPRPGWAEQDLEQMISQTMLVCREAVANCSISTVELTSVGFSTQGCNNCCGSERADPKTFDLLAGYKAAARIGR